MKANIWLRYKGSAVNNIQDFWEARILKLGLGKNFQVNLNMPKV